MQTRMALAALLMTTLSFAGCSSDGDDQPAFDCRTIEAELFVTSSPSSNIPVYTLNDGTTQMPVVAMGFSTDADPSTLEVPNPQVRMQECDTLILTVTNTNPLPHTFHLHGWQGDWLQDGVPFVTQLPILQGESHTYTFADMEAGTYWYHCHVDVAHHIDLGMYGAFIVEERQPRYDYDFDLEEHVLMLDEWDNCHVHGSIQEQQRVRENNGGATFESDCQTRKFQDTYGTSAGYDPTRDMVCNNIDPSSPLWGPLNCGSNQPPGASLKSYYPMTFPVYAPEYNTYTINGKAYPDTKAILFEEGNTYRFRLINVGEEMHSMHIHGHKMQIIKRDLDYLPAPVLVDTLGIMPGERYDVLIEATNPGFWVFHDHVGLNVMNDHQSPGGMLTIIGYEGDFAQKIGYDPATVQRSDDLQNIATRYLQENPQVSGLRRTNPGHDAEHLVVGNDRVVPAS